MTVQQIMLSYQTMRTKEEIVAERKRLKAKYGELLALVVGILCKHDPIGIAYEDNPHEYEPEAQTILARLRMCHHSDDVVTVAHEEFQQWFGPDVAGDRERYRSIGEEIWNRTRQSHSPHGQK